MAEYNIIAQSLWHSEKFKSLKKDHFAKLVFHYLVNSPHSNSCGCYPIHVGYIMADINCSEQDAIKAIESLSAANLIGYNFEENTVIIPNFLEHNPPRNPKHAIKVFNDSLSIPCKEFRRLCVIELLRIMEVKGWKLPKEKAQIAESLSKAYGIGLPGLDAPNPTQPNPTHIDIETKVSSCSEPEKPETEKKNDKPKTIKVTEVTFTGLDGKFYDFNSVTEMLWKMYPRMGRANKGKQKFADQVERYLTQNAKDLPGWNIALTKLSQSVQMYARYINETGELQPDPWRWMRDKGYDDDYHFTPRTEPKGAAQHAKRDNIGNQARDILDKLGQS